MIETHCGEIAFIDTGTDRQPVVFIHGNSSCKEVFEKQFNSRLADDYRLVAFDLPGHGASVRSSVPDLCYSIQNFAHLTWEISTQLALDSPVLAGWSLGGHIAIEAAAQGFDAKALVIFGTPPFGPGAEGLDSAFHPSEHMALTGKEHFNLEDAENYAEATLGGKKFVTKHLLEQVVNCDGRVRQTMLSEWASPENGHPAIPFVESWEQPIAVLHGEQDAFVQLSHLRNLRWKNLWRDEIQVIPDVGHASFWQAPDTFNKSLSEFLATI